MAIFFGQEGNMSYFGYEKQDEELKATSIHFTKEDYNKLYNDVYNIVKNMREESFLETPENTTFY